MAELHEALLNNGYAALISSGQLLLTVQETPKTKRIH